MILRSEVATGQDVSGKWLAKASTGRPGGISRFFLQVFSPPFGTRHSLAVSNAIPDR